MGVRAHLVSALMGADRLSDQGTADLSGVRRYDIISFTTYNDEEATRGSRARRET
jgi:hypothetical protein